MLVPSGQFRIFCSASPLDMLCGMERSAYLVKSELAMNPYSGAVFLFFNRNRTRAKIYLYDGSGSCLFMKRLEKGRFKLPQIDPTSKVATIAASELALLLEGIDTQKIARPARQTGRAQLAHPAFAPGLRFRSRHFSHGTWQPK